MSQVANAKYTNLTIKTYLEPFDDLCLIGKDIALEGAKAQNRGHSFTGSYIHHRAERVCLRLQIPRPRLRYFKTGVKNEHFRATNICMICFKYIYENSRFYINQ